MGLTVNITKCYFLLLSAAKTNILFIRAHELIKDIFNKPWILKYVLTLIIFGL
jgi:hypothetical protein